MGTKRLPSLFALACLLWLLCAPAVFAQQPNGPPDAGTVIGGVGAVMAVVIICMLTFIVIMFAIQIYLCYFLYTDANARCENCVLWLVLGLVGGWVGLIIWLCIWPEKGRRRRRR